MRGSLILPLTTPPVAVGPFQAHFQCHGAGTVWGVKPVCDASCDAWVHSSLEPDEGVGEVTGVAIGPVVTVGMRVTVGATEVRVAVADGRRVGVEVAVLTNVLVGVAELANVLVGVALAREVDVAVEMAPVW